MLEKLNDLMMERLGRSRWKILANWRESRRTLCGSETGSITQNRYGVRGIGTAALGLCGAYIGKEVSEKNFDTVEMWQVTVCIRQTDGKT